MFFLETVFESYFNKSLERHIARKEKAREKAYDEYRVQRVAEIAAGMHQPVKLTLEEIKNISSTLPSRKDYMISNK